jgi:hypothetical protein
MATIIVVPVDSCIGLLTNSSSEMFVSKKGMSLKGVKEALQKIVEGYSVMTGEPAGMSVFGEMKVLKDEEEALAFLREYDDYIISHPEYRHRMKELAQARGTKIAEIYQLKDKVKELEAFRELWEEEDNKEKKIFDDFIARFPDQVTRLVGCVVIHSSGSNTVPYDLFDTIDRKLGGFHAHLG